MQSIITYGVNVTGKEEARALYFSCSTFKTDFSTAIGLVGATSMSVRGEWVFGHSFVACDAWSLL